MPNSKWPDKLKNIAQESRKEHGGIRLGQYLYNVIRFSDNFPKTETAEQEEYEVGRILWYIEGSDLIELINKFEEKNNSVDK